MRFWMSFARRLARNSTMRKSARPCAWNGSLRRLFDVLSGLADARTVPPSRGTFRPETRKLLAEWYPLQERDVRGHVRVDSREGAV